MAKFKYTAVREVDGERVDGTVAGTSVDGVKEGLAKQGLQATSVVAQGRNILHAEITPKKVKLVELANFSRQMAAFVGAGVPILDALAVIEAEATDKVLKKVVHEVADSLRFGESFSRAMSTHGDAFPPFYVAVLQSAEATGELDVVLAQLAVYIERDMEAKRKIRAALAYPTLVLVMSIVTVVILTVFVLPRFKKFFESFDAELPFATRVLVSITDFLTGSWIELVIAFLLVILGGLLLYVTPRGRRIRDTVLLRAPIAGEVVRFTVIERFCRILSSMVQAGVPISESLRLAGSGANNHVFQESLLAARSKMLEGEGLYRPIANTGLFPGTVTQMMRVGEETGTLDQQLDAVATYYGRELEYKLKRLTNLFEPLCIIGVAVIVGFVAIALVSAIYGVYNQVDLQ